MKPDWKDAPEWAKYLAQNEDGRWFWYEENPQLYFDLWWSNEGRKAFAGDPLKGWGESKEERPC